MSITDRFYTGSNSSPQRMNTPLLSAALRSILLAFPERSAHALLRGMARRLDKPVVPMLVRVAVTYADYFIEHPSSVPSRPVPLSGRSAHAHLDCCVRRFTRGGCPTLGGLVQTLGGLVQTLGGLVQRDPHQPHQPACARQLEGQPPLVGAWWSLEARPAHSPAAPRRAIRRHVACFAATTACHPLRRLLAWPDHRRHTAMGRTSTKEPPAGRAFR